MFDREGEVIGEALARPVSFIQDSPMALVSLAPTDVLIGNDSGLANRCANIEMVDKR